MQLAVSENPIVGDQMFGGGTVVAYVGDTADTRGDFWLGVKRSESGSSKRKLYDIEWFDEVEPGLFELWDDGVDCMGLSRLLVEGVQMVPVQETGHFRLSRASREDVGGALAVWEPPEMASDEEEVSACLL